MTDKIKAIVVGLSELTGEEGLEVVKQVSVRFPPYSVACWEQLNDLFSQACAADAMLIFRDAPPQVLAALARLREGPHRTTAGVIIMLPEERSTTASEWRRFAVIGDAEMADELVVYADPEAKTEIDGYILTVTVTKPEFSHIEWF